MWHVLCALMELLHVMHTVKRSGKKASCGCDSVCLSISTNVSLGQFGSVYTICLYFCLFTHFFSWKEFPVRWKFLLLIFLWQWNYIWLILLTAESVKLSKQLSVVWLKRLVGQLVQVLEGIECQKGKKKFYTISSVIYLDDDLEINLLIWYRLLYKDSIHKNSVIPWKLQFMVKLLYNLKTNVLISRIHSIPRSKLWICSVVI